MPGLPIASVIVLNWNTRAFIDDCLLSLLDQDMNSAEYEILFVDNGSSDGSAEYVEKHYPSVRLLRWDRNYGFAEGNNRAIPYARGRYLAFINVDTVAHRRWLPELVQTITTLPKVKACHSNQVMPWVDEYSKMERDELLSRAYVYDLSRLGYVTYASQPFHHRPVRTLFLSGASTMIDRSILNKLEYAFDPSFFAYCEDLDLALRINALGFKTVMVPTSILYHRNPLSVKVWPDLATARQISRLISNKIIAYFKSMNLLEFILFLPLLLIGTPCKVTMLPWSGLRKAVYLLASIPLTFFAFARAVTELPRFIDKRRRVLEQRQGGRFWLIKQIVARPHGRSVNVA